MNLADGLDDQIGRSLLEHNPGAAEFHGLDKLVLVFVGREDDDLGGIIGALQGLQRRQPVGVGHAQVEQNHVRAPCRHVLKQHLPVGRLSNYVNILLSTIG